MEVHKRYSFEESWEKIHENMFENNNSLGELLKCFFGHGWEC